MISVGATFGVFVADGVLLPELQPIVVKINRRLNTSSHETLFTFTPPHELCKLHIELAHV